MPTIPNGAPLERKPAEGGTFFGRCIRVLHFGTIIAPFNGQWKEIVHLDFEYRNTEGQKKVIGKDYTFNYYNTTALAKMLATWLGRGLTPEESGESKPVDPAKIFNMDSLCGKAAMLSISVNAKGYADISAIAPPPHGIDIPAAEKTMLFNFDEHFSEEKIAALPTFIQNKIKGSKEYAAINFDHLDSPVSITPPVQPVINNPAPPPVTEVPKTKAREITHAELLRLGTRAVPTECKPLKNDPSQMAELFVLADSGEIVYVISPNTTPENLPF